MISPTTSAGQTTAGAATTPVTDPTDPTSDGLGRDAFLKLLVTQLQHQDPTQPQDDSIRPSQNGGNLRRIANHHARAQSIPGEFVRPHGLYGPHALVQKPVISLEQVGAA